MSDGILDHLILQGDLVFAHREVRLQELRDPVVDPLRGDFLIRQVQGEFHLVMWFETHQDREDLQVVPRDYLMDVPVPCRGELLPAGRGQISSHHPVRARPGSDSGSQGA
jgi:hypothetical protein